MTVLKKDVHDYYRTGSLRPQYRERGARGLERRVMPSAAQAPPDQPASRPPEGTRTATSTVFSRRYFTSESFDFKLEGGAYLLISPLVFLHKLQED